jgi:predicted site-specific integrase-resolvase
LKLLDDTEPSLVIPISDSTLGAGLESMKRMTRAALYAGVSSERQKQEQTIESQVAELKRQNCCRRSRARQGIH